MSNRSLQSISGRIPSKPGTRVSEVASHPRDTLSEKTESITSDHPAPSSSNVFVPSIPIFDLQASFPSILSTLDLMKSHERKKDLAGFFQLAEVFSTCFRAILRSFNHLPYRTRRDTSYELSQCTAILAERLFATEVLNQRRTMGDQTTQSRLIELAEVTITSLQDFLKVAERLVAAKKPLPPLPIDGLSPNISTSDVDRGPAPLVNIVAEAVHDGAITETSSNHTPKFTDDPSKGKRKFHQGNIIRRILKKKDTSSSTYAFFLHKSKSPLTTINSSPAPVKEPLEAEIQVRSTEVVYFPRQSAIYYLADPYCPEVDIEMPVPTEDAVSIRLNANGEMKAASLPALVRILTSKESVVNQDFTPTFFICFRFFTTPILFFQELVNRFDEQPPTGLNPAQLRIWTQNAVGVHIRVGKVILMWLDLYWKPEADLAVLEPLQIFTLDRLVRELPEAMATHILEGLDLVGGEVPICRRAQKAKDLEFIYEKMIGNVPATPQFDISSLITGLVFNLTTFDTPLGRQEFAHQLTVNFSGRFQQVDPEDAVMYWHRNDDSNVGKILREIISVERSLCTWVIQTVLDQPTQKERCNTLEFWLDVASRCLRLRNFSSAYCIWNGVSHSAIQRMKKTILGVSIPSKLQFQVLQNFLGGQDNYREYRQTLTSAEPTVPMIAPLIRDVISTFAVVPTTIESVDDSDRKPLINFCAYQVITKTVRGMETCLIPYKIDSHEAFQNCLGTHFANFPPELETAITDNFYKMSSELESKEPLLDTLRDPWLYTMTGSQHKKYQLLELPQQPPPFLHKKGIAHWLGRL